MLIDTKNFHDNDNFNDVKKLSPKELISLYTDDPFRLKDNPEALAVLTAVMADPENIKNQSLLKELIENRQLEKAQSGDMFWENYPAFGSIVYAPDLIDLGVMPTGDHIGIYVSQTRVNGMVIGPTRTCKTSAIKKIISNPILVKDSRVIVFDRKQEFRGLLRRPELYGLVVILEVGDLAIALGQPADGTPTGTWAGKLSTFTGQVYSKLAAHKLVNETLINLQADCGEGQYPSLADLIGAIESIKSPAISRRYLYKESMLASLKDLSLMTEGAFDYNYSDFLLKLFTTPGLAVIEVPMLSFDHLSFLMTYMFSWEYSRRVKLMGGTI